MYQTEIIDIQKQRNHFGQEYSKTYFIWCITTTITTLTNPFNRFLWYLSWYIISITYSCLNIWTVSLIHLRYAKFITKLVKIPFHINCTCLTCLSVRVTKVTMSFTAKYQRIPRNTRNTFAVTINVVFMKFFFQQTTLRWLKGLNLNLHTERKKTVKLWLKSINK